MNYPLPSLQQFCYTRVSLSLITGHKVENLIIENLTTNDVNWKKIQRQIVNNIDKLTLPRVLKKKLTPISIYVGKEIERWFRNHNEDCLESHQYLKLSRQFLAKYVKRLQWTSMGSVDIRKMAHLYVQDPKLSCAQRFNIACYFNITEEINDIWRNELRFEILVRLDLAAIRYTETFLVNYWIHCIEGELDSLNESILDSNHFTSMHKEVFLEVARDGFEPAMDFFYDKLSEKDQKRCLSRLIYNKNPYNHEMELFNFLYKRLNQEQMILFVRNHPSCFLHNLVRWPYFEIFETLIAYALDVIGVRDYFAVLIRAVNGATNNKHDEEYVKIFQFLWNQSETRHKEFIFEAPPRLVFFLRKVVCTRRSYLARMVLVDLLDRGDVSFASNISAPNLFRPLIFNEQWDLIEDYLTVFAPTHCRAHLAYREMDFHVLIKEDNAIKENWFKHGRAKFEKRVKELWLLEHCKKLRKTKAKKLRDIRQRVTTIGTLLDKSETYP